MVVISHVAPEGAGDVPNELYHKGFGAYRWLLDRFRPPLWLHGHTTTASVTELQVAAGPTTVVNVTGAVLVSCCRPPPRVIPARTRTVRRRGHGTLMRR